MAEWDKEKAEATRKLAEDELKSYMELAGEEEKMVCRFLASWFQKWVQGDSKNFHATSWKGLAQTFAKICK
jgi:hypothetical protein